MVKEGTSCDRCGEPTACLNWRGKLVLCETCWCALEEWAEHLEWSVRVRLEQNRELREAAKRRPIEGENVVQLFKAR